MNEIKIIIEKSKNHYSSYAENVEGIYGGGATIDEAKQSIFDAICLLKEYNREDNIPAILKNSYQLVFQLDCEIVN
jgi:predicted RNase H-like HicB family nuclease